MTTTPTTKHPQEGLDRCPCGAKYWDGDNCHSCGSRFNPDSETLFIAPGVKSTGDKQVDDTLRGVIRALNSLPASEAEATIESMLRVAREFMRRAQQVGPDAALTEARDWSEAAPAVILLVLQYIDSFAAIIRTNEEGEANA